MHRIRFARRSLVSLIAFGFALAVSGCADEDPLAPEADLPPAPPATDTTSAAGVIAAYEYALVNKNLEMHSALLEQPSEKSDGFKYVPRYEDIEDFGWLPATGWDYDIEVGIIGNMMNPDFVGGEGGNSIVSIAFQLTILNERVVEDGGVEVTCSADITVLWGDNDGARSDVRFLFILFPDGDGFLRIRTIAELPSFKRSVEDYSWGSVKARYRS